MKTSKIFLALAFVGLVATCAFAVSAQTGTGSGTASTINNTCVQTAVDAREQAVASAWTALNSSMTSALSARQTALHNAWGITDGPTRRAARAAAWSAFETASKNAISTFRTARNSAWSAFAKASSACGVPVVEGPTHDTLGGIGL